MGFEPLRQQGIASMRGLQHVYGLDTCIGAGFRCDILPVSDTYSDDTWH
jgi:hypothetical protein